MVEPLSKKHFPVCMKTMQHTLQNTHHLKYKARLQYGLFLKGIGMTLEDAMKFFRAEFCKRADVDVDKFEKEYAYGIRYNYGKMCDHVLDIVTCNLMPEGSVCNNFFL